MWYQSNDIGVTRVIITRLSRLWCNVNIESISHVFNFNIKVIRLKKLQVNAYSRKLVPFLPHMIQLFRMEQFDIICVWKVNKKTANLHMRLSLELVSVIFRYLKKLSRCSPNAGFTKLWTVDIRYPTVQTVHFELTVHKTSFF